MERELVSLGESYLSAPAPSSSAMVSRARSTCRRGVKRTLEGATAEKGDMGERGELDVKSMEKNFELQVRDATSTENI